jgi:hypothetical protein
MCWGTIYIIMSTSSPGKADTSAFLNIVGEYQIRGGRAYVYGNDDGVEVVLVRPAGPQDDR